MTKARPLKISITGATGFVGRHVVQTLREDGHHITALVRNLAIADLPEDVRLISGDLEQIETLQNLVAGADVVIHLAGATMALNRDGFFAVNTAGTERVADAAVLAGVKRVIYVSSLAAREPQLSAYAASKRAGEIAMEKFLSEDALLILRPAAIYGPGDMATLPLLRALSQKIAILPGRRNQRISLLYVRDFAEVLASAVADDRHGTFEIGDNNVKGYRWVDVQAAARVVQGNPKFLILLPKFLPLLVGCASEIISRWREQASIVSRGKIAELYHRDWVAAAPGWPRSHAVGLEQGFRETFAWYETNGWLPQVRRKASANTGTIDREI